MTLPTRTQPMTATEVLQAPRLLALEAREASLKARIQELEDFVKRTIQRPITPDTGYSVAQAMRADARAALQPRESAK